MGRMNIEFDEKAEKAVGLAKAIARGEANRRLDSVHLLKAVLLAYPAEATFCSSKLGPGWSEAILGFVTPATHLKADSDQMPVTRELAAMLRELGRGGHIIELGPLMENILNNPSVRVKALLHQVGDTPSSARSSSKGKSWTSPCYATRRDWLSDLRRQWLLRKAAARACGIKVGLGGSVEDRETNYRSDFAMDAAIRAAVSTKDKAKASTANLHPLAALEAELDPTEQAVCEGVLVDHLYGLDVHPFGGLSTRDLAQMLCPELYPSNCRKVFSSVKELEGRGILACRDPDGPIEVTQRLRLTEHAVEQILADLEIDGISNGEMEFAKRQLRLDSDWEMNGSRTVT